MVERYACVFFFMFFKLNCSDCPCGTGEDSFCNSISKEYFVHLNRIVSLRQLFVAGKKISNQIFLGCLS